jgi:hypothetical protein
MAEQQNGVSPASAGGASTPDPIGTVRAVNGVLFVLGTHPDYGRRWWPVEGGGQYEDGENWRQESRPVIGAVSGTPAARGQRGELAEIRAKLAEVHDAAQYDDISTVRAVEMLAEQRDGMMAGWGRCHEKYIAQRKEVAQLQRHLDEHLADENSAQAANDRLRDELQNLNAGHEATLRFITLRLADILDTSEETALTDLLDMVQGVADARDEFQQEWHRADAEVTRLKRLVGNENVEPNWKTVDRREAIRQAVQFHTDLQAVMQQRDAVVRQLGKAEDEVAEVAAERDRLRAELDGIRPRVRELANALGISTSEPGAFEQWIAEQDRSSEPEPICGAGNEDYPELRCKRVAGHEQHEDPSHGATWSPEIATAAKPRRWYAHSPEPEVGTVVGLPDRKPNGPTWTRHPAGGWQRSNSPGYRMAWKSLFGDCGELVEVVSTDG